VRVVHGLQCDARVVAVEVAVLHELFDRVDYLVRAGRGAVLVRYWIVAGSRAFRTFLSRLACSSLASNTVDDCQFQMTLLVLRLCLLLTLCWLGMGDKHLKFTRKRG
jgi:hypothetical protein